MSQDLIPFSDDDIQKMIVNAVEKFFSTMLDWSVDYSAVREGITELDDDEPPPLVFQTKKPLVVGMVGFVGAMSGILNLHLEEDLAVSITSAFLGMTEEEVAEEGHEVINDALGEMGNMVGGTFKNELCDLGYDCRLTLPSILRGSNFSIETPSGVYRRLYDFKTNGIRFVADVTLKPGD
jgi:chemotaxis protein CheX